MIITITILGDNKESNISLGYIRSFNASYYCRYCRMHKRYMRKLTSENPEYRRNRQNYEEDVLVRDQSLTGVREYSPLNAVPHFHVTESSAEDTTHVVEEGICNYNVAEALYFLIYNDRIFTLDQLNNRMKHFSYGEEEKANKPHFILDADLDKINLKMTAAEMTNFVHNLPFIIGDLVPEGHVVWLFLLDTITFFDFCYLPCYENEDLNEWKEIIKRMHEDYIHIFGTHLKPVHHFSIHFPADTKKYGPLRYTRSIR